MSVIKNLIKFRARKRCISICINLHLRKIGLSFLVAPYTYSQLWSPVDTLIYCNMFSFVALPMLMGLYPFDPISKGRDRSPNKAPNAIFSNVVLTQGPDGRPNSAVKLLGLPNSYVQIPNNGKLRATTALSIFAWIKPQGNAGPIINYNVGPAWETHLWLKNSKTLLARYVKVGGGFTPSVSKTVLSQNAWSFVGTTYDGTFERLWVNEKNVATRKIGSIRLSTNGPIRIGAKIGDPRYFKGAVACVQLYRVALHKKQIRRAMKRCIRSKYLSVSALGALTETNHTKKKQIPKLMITDCVVTQ